MARHEAQEALPSALPVVLSVHQDHFGHSLDSERAQEGSRGHQTMQAGTPACTVMQERQVTTPEMTEENPKITETGQTAVLVKGALSCIDSNGARPMTPDEFHRCIGRMADHLDDETRISDPSVWGQASSGDMEVYFLLPTASGPALNRQIAEILGEMTDAAELIWANDPRPRRTEAASILAQTSQLVEPVAA